MKSSLFLAVFVIGCSKTSAPQALPNASPSSSATSVASVSTSGDAAVAKAHEICGKPDRLVQLGTVKQQAHFQDEALVGEHDAFDPETLKAMARPPTTPKPRAVTPSRYNDVKAGRGLIAKEQEGSAVVESVDTHKVLLHVGPCSAGGSIAFALSTTGRFLICSSNRAGDTLWDLSAAHPKAESPMAFAKDQTSIEGLSLAPNDAYAVAAPVISWGTSEPTRQELTYFDLNARTSKPIAKAPLKGPDENDGSFPTTEPYGVAFCGDGAIFAAASDKDVAVYDSANASKLASAPAMPGGKISFSASGRYLSQTRGNATTVFRLEP